MGRIKIQKNFRLLLSCSLFFSLLGCGSDQSQPEKPTVQVVSEVQEVSETKRTETFESGLERSSEQFDLSSRVKASRVYALDMFKQINAYNNVKTPEKNIIISPLSIEYVMAMLMNGADKQDSEEIAEALHLSGVDPEALNQTLAKNMQFHQQQATIDTQLILANGIFILRDYSINPEYQQKMKSLYQANIQTVSKDNGDNIINGWVNRQTQGRIKKVVSKPAADTTLVNTVYFKGKWPDKFFQKEFTEKRLFNGMKKQESTPTMFQGALSRYYEDQNVQALYQPYKGEDYAILLLLPKGKTAGDLDKFVSQLSESYFTQILDSSSVPTKNYQGTLYLPKFEVEYKNDNLLENSQQFLGIDLRKLSFPNIVNTGLKISRMLQIANITLDEEGTEATAVTVVEMEVTAANPESEESLIYFEMDINHPFAYAILDKEGNIVFIGTVKDIH